MFDSSGENSSLGKISRPALVMKSMFRGMKGAGLYKADEGILRGVILGCEMAEADKADIIAAARECGARVYQAKPKTFDFGLDITLVQDKPGNRA